MAAASSTSPPDLLRVPHRFSTISDAGELYIQANANLHLLFSWCSGIFFCKQCTSLRMCPGKGELGESVSRARTRGKLRAASLTFAVCLQPASQLYTSLLSRSSWHLKPFKLVEKQFLTCPCHNMPLPSELCQGCVQRCRGWVPSLQPWVCSAALSQAMQRHQVPPDRNRSISSSSSPGFSAQAGLPQVLRVLTAALTSLLWS